MTKNNPFEEALKNFKPTNVEKSVEEVEESPIDSERTSSPVEDETENPALEINENTKEQEEDMQLFSELSGLLEIKKSDNSYFRIRDLIADSRKYDVSFDVNRYLHSRLSRSSDSRVKEIVDMILKRGYIAEATNWLQSTTLEGMQSGTANREERIEKAKGFAEKAGVPLSEIAQGVGISL